MNPSIGFRFEYSNFSAWRELNTEVAKTQRAAELVEPVSARSHGSHLIVTIRAGHAVATPIDDAGKDSCSADLSSQPDTGRLSRGERGPLGPRYGGTDANH